MGDLYTDKAERVRVVGTTAEGQTLISKMHLVDTTDDDGPSWDELAGPVEIYTGKLYAERPKLDDDDYVVRLRERTEKQLNGLADLYRKTNEAKRQHDETVKAILEIQPGLERTLTFLRGGFTHAVIFGGWDPPRIVESNSPILFDDFREKSIKLMALVGNPQKKKCELNLNRYRDGSGNWDYTVELFGSNEEAVAFLAAMMTNEFAKDSAKNGGYGKLLIEVCKTYGIEVPETIIEAQRELEIKSKQRNLANIEAQRIRALAELAEAESMPGGN